MTRLKTSDLFEYLSKNGSNEIDLAELQKFAEQREKVNSSKAPTEDFEGDVMAVADTSDFSEELVDDFKGDPIAVAKPKKSLKPMVIFSDGSETPHENRAKYIIESRKKTLDEYIKTGILTQEECEENPYAAFNPKCYVEQRNYVRLLKSSPELLYRMRIKEICNVLADNSPNDYMNKYLTFSNAVKILDGDEQTIRNFVDKILQIEEVEYRKKYSDYKSKLAEYEEECAEQGIEPYTYPNNKRSKKYPRIPRQPRELCMTSKAMFVKSNGQISDSEYAIDYLHRFKNWVNEICIEYLKLPANIPNCVKLFAIVAVGRYEDDIEAKSLIYYIITRRMGIKYAKLDLSYFEGSYFNDIVNNISDKLFIGKYRHNIKTLDGKTINLFKVCANIKKIYEELESYAKEIFNKYKSICDKYKLNAVVDGYAYIKLDRLLHMIAYNKNVCDDYSTLFGPDDIDRDTFLKKIIYLDMKRIGLPVTKLD